ncbi:MAG: MFS transporter [Proteobacteria bacterium]|nr:MFS transporter [Pseudomonadota bacterium]
MLENGHAKPGRPEQLATRLSFFFIGVTLANWAALVPFAKVRTGLDDTWLGFLLLCLGAGSIIAMPLSGALSTRFGCRTVILACGLVVALLLLPLSFLNSGILMAVSLFVFGATIGACEVAMNIQAVIVEKGGGRPLMSGFHGCFSLGGFAGAGGMSVLLSLGVSPVAATLVIVIALILILLAASRRNLAYGNEGGARSPLFVMPHGIVVFIGFLCFVIFLAEGAMLDWSGQFLVSQRGFDPTTAGTGYSAFAIAMTVGRFAGDWIVAHLGRARVMALGGLGVTLGFLAAVLAPVDAASLLGFILIGLGASNIVPVLYTATGAQKVMSPSHAVAAITTIGYAGILLGPAVIGPVSDWTSLSFAFGLIGALVLVIPLSARFIAGQKS